MKANGTPRLGEMIANNEEHQMHRTVPSAGQGRWKRLSGNHYTSLNPCKDIRSKSQHTGFDRRMIMFALHSIDLRDGLSYGIVSISPTHFLSSAGTKKRTQSISIAK